MAPGICGMTHVLDFSWDFTREAEHRAGLWGLCLHPMPASPPPESCALESQFLHL